MAPEVTATSTPQSVPVVSVPVNLQSLEWEEGLVDSASLPPRSALKPLPGGGTGGPVLVSNNPEVFIGNGVLFGTFNPSSARGGGRLSLAGSSGFYIHHLNRAATAKTISIVVQNNGSSEATLSFFGSGYNQTETGGLGLGVSPDYRVSAEWIQGQHTTRVNDVRLGPQELRALWSKSVNPGAEVDGRFGLRVTGSLNAAVIVTDGTTPGELATALAVDAPGDIARSGNPPPPFGREAGVYANDTWEGTIHALVPRGERRAGFWVNTATGSGASQTQAFPALLAYDDSARESVGMYGNVYDITIALTHDNADRDPRRVRVLFASLATAAISRYWDGLGLVDSNPTILRHTPDAKVTLLAETDLSPGSPARVLRFRAMVPGLTSIPQAIYLESR